MTIYKIDEKNEIFYEHVIPIREGGSTCVFINALTGDSSAWTGTIGNQIVKGGDGYLAYNYRGQINTKFDKRLDLDSETIVSDLINLINYIKPENVILIGLSIGGLYAAMAVQKGIEAKGLVLINTLRKPSERLNWINKAAANAVRFAGTSIVMDMLMPVIASPDFLIKLKEKALNPENYHGLGQHDGVNKLMQGSLTTNWEFDWSVLNLPTLVMTGHHDKVFRIPKDVDEIICKMNKVIRVEIPECGHLIPLENPELFAYHLIGFIKQVNYR